MKAYEGFMCIYESDEALWRLYMPYKAIIDYYSSFIMKKVDKSFLGLYKVHKGL